MADGVFTLPDATVMPTDTARVPRPVTTSNQTALCFGDMSSLRLAIKITLCRARIVGPHAAGLEIDLCLCELAEAKNQGNDADKFFHFFEDEVNAFDRGLENLFDFIVSTLHGLCAAEQVKPPHGQPRVPKLSRIADSTANGQLMTT